MRKFTSVSRCCVVGGLFLLLGSSSALAWSWHNARPYFGVSLGDGLAKVEHNNTSITYYNNGLTDYYPTKHGGGVATAVAGLNGGYEFAGHDKRPAVAVGLGIYTTPTDYVFQGKVFETASGDPTTQLFNYEYSLTSTRVMAELQLTWQVEQFSPFLNAGVGPVWNQLSNYTEDAVDSSGFSAVPAFHGHTTLALAYQLGFGVGYGFNLPNTASSVKNERLSLGYRYVNLGHAGFGTRSADYPFHLNAGHIWANEFYLGFTHFFS